MTGLPILTGIIHILLRKGNTRGKAGRPQSLNMSKLRKMIIKQRREEDNIEGNMIYCKVRGGRIRKEETTCYRKGNYGRRKARRDSPGRWSQSLLGRIMTNSANKKMPEQANLSNFGKQNMKITMTVNVCRTLLRAANQNICVQKESICQLINKIKMHENFLD